MQRNGVGTIIFGKHTFLNGRTRFFERERKKDIFKLSFSFCYTALFHYCVNVDNQERKIINILVIRRINFVPY